MQMKRISSRDASALHCLASCTNPKNNKRKVGFAELLEMMDLIEILNCLKVQISIFALFTLFRIFLF